MICDFNQSQARMLLVVGTESAVIRASSTNRSVIDICLLRWLEKYLTTFSVVPNIVSDENIFCSVFGATL